MTDFLNSLDRKSLMKIYKEFGNKDKGNYATQSKETLVKWLSTENKISQDDISLFLNGLEITSTQSTEVIDPKKVKQSYDNADKNALLHFQNEMKRKAMETVVISVIPQDKRTIEIGKQAESFCFANQFFECSRVVPFNTPVEVPRCIADVIREAVAPQYKSFENSKGVKSQEFTLYAGYPLMPKYNVVELDKKALAKA